LAPDFIPRTRVAKKRGPGASAPEAVTRITVERKPRTLMGEQPRLSDAEYKALQPAARGYVVHFTVHTDKTLL